MTKNDLPFHSLKVIAIASSEEVRALLYKQLQQLEFIAFSGVFLELSDAVQACHEIKPDVLIVDATGRELDTGLFIQAIDLDPSHPCPIYALHRDMDYNIFKTLLRQGASEFIQYPTDSNGLVQTLKKHQTLLSRLTSANREALSKESQTGLVAEKGKLLACFSAKGGVGCSTIALNLAHELVRIIPQTKKEEIGQNNPLQGVVLVDLDQSFCNSGLMLNQKPGYSLGDIAGTSLADVDEALLHQLIIPHETGLHVVVGTKNVLDDHDMIPVELLALMLDYLTTHYAYTIIDLPTHILDPYHEYVAQRADDLLLISGSDICSLYRTDQYLSLARQYLGVQKIKMILNRYNLKAAYQMSNSEVEEEFHQDIYARIPNDWNVSIEASSFGVSIHSVSPNCEMAKALTQLAMSLMRPQDKDQSNQTLKTPPLLERLISSLQVKKG